MTPFELIKATLKEDAPHGDITCKNLVQELKIANDKTLGHFIAKQDLVFSGSLFFMALKELNLGLEVELFFKDGSQVKKGQTIAQVFGPWTQLVFVERSLLNLIGRFSGIATLTRKFVDQVKHTPCKILDTRKTTPLFRNYEKAAVIHGGGTNHRMNLSSEIMLKENHLCRITKSLVLSLTELKEKNPQTKITIECQTLDEVKFVSQTPVDQILLDNMDLETLREAVTIIPKRIKSEASGNMTLERVKSVAEVGVDFISVGAITHSAPVADISFLIDR